MPLPTDNTPSISRNMLINEQLAYDREASATEFEELYSNLNEGQLQVFHEVTEAVIRNEGGVYFVYGHGGTGKTYVWKTLASSIRSKGQIVLTVASSGIASLLLPGGRMAHSRFGIPIEISEDSTCSIRQGSELPKLLIDTQLIIWDEAPMVHKFCFEALDRTLRDLLRFKNPKSHEIPFGGKVIVLGGDFRQILPVIPKGSRQDIVSAALTSSYLWEHCKVLRLTMNMRLQTNQLDDDSKKTKEFSEWILRIGDGKENFAQSDYLEIQIPKDILITDVENPLQTIVETTFPNLLGTKNTVPYIRERAILAPTLEVVQEVNDYILSQWPGEEQVYLSSDNICKVDEESNGRDDVYTTEFLNSITSSGVPNHRLVLKVGIPIMLLRNIDQSSGLCNGTRLIVTKLGTWVIEAKPISTENTIEKIFIPRLDLTPSDIRLPFKFQRRQFPVVV